MLRTAVRQVEKEGLRELTRLVSREHARDLLHQLARSMESPDDPPYLPGSTAAAREVTRQLERLLFAQVVQEWSRGGRAIEPHDVLATMRGFARAREQLSGIAAGADASDGIPPDVLDLAHDLRSPLTSVLFIVESLRHGQSGGLTEMQQHLLDLAYGAALGLGSLINDVIDFARPDESRLERSASPFSIRILLESIRDMVQPLVFQKALELRVTGVESDLRNGYPATLSRVLLNLTSNALKFTETGYVELSAREVAPGRVEFSVRDTGNGLPPELTADLFQPFRRGTRDHRAAFDGSGLGLLICRKLLRPLGAELRYETAAGVGTRFHFEVDLPEHAA